MSDYWNQFLTMEDTDTSKDTLPGLEEPQEGTEENDANKEDKPTGQEVPGNESFGTSYMNTKPSSIPFFAPVEMCGRGGNQPDIPLLVRTSDEKNFRVYIKEDMAFCQNYVNKLCFFLDSRTPGQTVMIILGAKLCDEQAHMVGAILSAIQTCKARVIGVCAGYCGVTETLLWCYCPNRLMYRYGALSFGISNIVKEVPSYMKYFEKFLNKAQGLNILTEDEVRQIKETGCELMILYSEYAQRVKGIESAPESDTEADTETSTSEEESIASTESFGDPYEAALSFKAKGYSFN